MSDLIHEIQDRIFLITLNRTDKHNAFDDALLVKLQLTLDQALNNSDVRVIILKANGQHFSAGADLSWMQRMVHYNEQENFEDAKQLAKVMFTLYQSAKPTIAMVQGAAYGGGVGLVAACDIAVASMNARFCFSEVKLGLIPAVISPYVIRAIGARSTAALFMSAEIFDAKRAYELQLVHHCVSEDVLLSHTLHLAQQIASMAPLAIKEAKTLVRNVAPLSIDNDLLAYTASLIAKKRISAEGQEGLHAFLNKKNPPWN